MSKILSKSVVAIALASVSLASATPALARHHYNDGYYQNRGDGYYQNSRYNDGRYDNRDYDYRRDSNWRGNRCDKGTGGLIIGAIAGGLLGNAVVGRRGDKTAGTIVGAGVGALAGRSIDRSDSRNRC